MEFAAIPPHRFPQNGNREWIIEHDWRVVNLVGRAAQRHAECGSRCNGLLHLLLQGFSREDLVAGWNLKDGGIGLAAVDLRDRGGLFSGAWIFMDGEHVQPQVFGIPVFVDDFDFLSAVASAGMVWVLRIPWTSTPSIFRLPRSSSLT